MPAVEARRLSELCITVLQKMRGDAEFDLFWSLAVHTQAQLDVNNPVLEHYRKRPRRYDSSSSDSYSQFSDPKSYYRCIYFQCLDTAVVTLKDRFH